ncbi:MAG: hypothetical protein HQL56_02450 [Magnetococcales bacterium]|nr:hypothetical protein [Magnetococcales bacterium]
MNTTRIILLLVILGLIVGLFFQGPSSQKEGTLFNNLITWGIMGYLWYLLRNKTGEPDHSVHDPAPRSEPPPGRNESPFPGSAEGEPDASPERPWFHVLSRSDDDDGYGKAIFHKTPFRVVEQGINLGRFRSHPIPAWIRTSDGRQAYYWGITSLSIPEECVCLEFPSRGELIIAPGLVYAVQR